MEVHIAAPSEYQGPCIALLNKRKGMIGDSEVDNDYVQVEAEVPLNEMFGFSTDLRSITQVGVS
jgi:elongation factor G